ncbi:NADH:ubiquinone oxidoreductase [Orbilia oligospora]|uniref:NADH:ubiquinone oxidoreductase n=2 Tax=Orbilia oligospora TaxID=2813651 RepID=A0A7C8NAU3_ORBOL|nr:NADH:ubiquinone oxidoreductase [Orbilia oligospora]KAF3093465.1 NADH:ubiquinone oxidoreductase [Orbilia oligospora]KAF3107853.1 NADH:ubiquinone oxidoreductase [Orbilia oligospora]KAF3119162.1 NADH:ubiquinone oxidoreductase [Orbilia oligospora]
MMAAADLASPQKPDWLSPSEEVEWYKSQYASLEQELLEFQTFSKELETELERELKTLEKEVEGHERNINTLRKKNEGLKYEVDEWKTKFKSSKEEANHVQNQLQKEITELREKNRTAQIRIREMEVSNDDFERNERIVKSSLDDLESKYNMAIERNVMNESEIQMLEQEREELRIELQRFKDELAELKVEAELSEEKYRMARRGTSNPRFQSPMPDAPTTPTSVSPTPRLSRATPSADFSSPTPPSPPISETSTSGSRIPTPHKDHLMTPKASHYRRGLPKGTPKKTPSMANLSDSARKKLIGNAAVAAKNNSNIPGPNSKSLTQIRGLIGQMQRLEKRVQTARSKMPPPAAKTPPRRMSPHLGSSAFLPPSSINLRRNIKKPGSTTSSVTSTSIDERFGSLSRSFASHMVEAITRTDTPSSRPSSRTSSRQSYSTAGQGISRPSSRASTSNVSHIPVPEYSLPASKPRSSIGGLNDDIFATPRRGLTRTESGAHSRAVSTSGGSAIPRRKSMQTIHGGAGSMSASYRRVSGGLNSLNLTDKNAPPVPPVPPTMRRKKLSGVGDA